ncbi:MAG: Rieske 2Fe-2S domain-containing protein, partial [Gammaproteobacteria bacterium]
MAQPQTQLSQTLQDERKRALMEATVRAIHIHGLSKLTLAKIAGLAGLTAGTVNFHFASKESLLLATLKHLAEEFDLAIQQALASAGSDPAMCLRALVDANLEIKLADPRKIAVWYAFMSEASSREDYQRICDDRDSAYYRSVLELCRSIAASQPADRRSDAEAVAYGLVGLLDLIWQEILFSGPEFDSESARRRCTAYLASVFPGVFPMPGAAPGRLDPAETTRDMAPVQEGGLSYTLPSWVYESAGFFELEKDHLFLPSWQVVCHVSDLPRAGSYATFEMFRDRAFVIRDRDGTIRAFHNVCRHRAHTVVQVSVGACPGRLICPYHGWTYALDGRRIGIGSPQSFRTHDGSAFGLMEL